MPVVNGSEYMRGWDGEDGVFGEGGFMGLEKGECGDWSERLRICNVFNHLKNSSSSCRVRFSV